MNTSEYGWIHKVEVRLGRGTVYVVAGFSLLSVAVLVAATLFAAERQTKPSISRDAPIYASPAGVPGACCDSQTGECEEVYSWVCIARGDTFQGDGTLCAMCNGGLNVGMPCRQCDGGGNPGAPCTGNADCIGGTCTPNNAACPPPGVCSNDPNQQCVTNADCPFPGTCGPPQCVALAECASGACCDPSTGTCSLITGPAACEVAGVFQGFGTDCDPNCCPQPNLGLRCMGGPNNLQNCTDDSHCRFCVGGSHNKEACTTTSAAEPDGCLNVGTCNLTTHQCVGGLPPSPNVCVTDADCPDNSGVCRGRCVKRSTGGDNCEDAYVHAITVPPPGDAPKVITITGDNSGATSTPEEPDSCFGPIGGTNVEPGWFEAFTIDDCARVRIDLCCSDPLHIPAYDVLYKDCVCIAPILDCVCGAPIHAMPDPYVPGQPASGYGQPYCPEGNFWATFPLLAAGSYSYPINSVLAGAHGPYQMHITVEACPTAACCYLACSFGHCSVSGATCVGTGQGTCPFGQTCNSINCVTDLVCTANSAGTCDSKCNVLTQLECDAIQGFSLQPPQVAQTIPLCIGNPCDQGSCCLDDGQCLDSRQNDANPMTKAICEASFNGTYIGGVRCKGGTCIGGPSNGLSCSSSTDCQALWFCDGSPAQLAQPNPCLSLLCGNGVVDPGEDCDGSADALCPGLCWPHCVCPPAVEIDVFESSLGRMDLQYPGGNELITLSGPTTVHVFFEGANMGDANDDEGVVGLDEVQTEMVNLQLSGTSSFGPVLVTLHPTKPSRGRIEEKDNTLPGRLDLPPFALSGTADSFFDIFFKVQAGPFTFYTQQPKRLTSVITHKPPGPGDTYENLEKIPLLDENGDPTGYSIGASRHIPQPVVEIDVFESSLGRMDLQGPGGNELITLSGPTTVHVFFEGPTLGSADDDDGNLRDEVTTEIVDMQLTGNSSFGPVLVTLHPTKPSRGMIEETGNTEGGRLDLPPFAPSGTASSFFDIFFKVQVGPFTFYTQQPKRLSSVITHKPPGPGDTYENLEKIPLLDENGDPTGYSIGASRHIPQPVVEVDVFGSSLGRMELQFPFPPGGSEVIALSGPTTVHVFFEGPTLGSADDDDGNGRDEVQTEMVDMQLTGNSVPLGPVLVTLHPTKPSRGRIEEKDNTQPGRLDLPPFALSGTADSFFDIFFKVQAGPFTFYTQQPKRLSSWITHKPPAPGDTYENLEKIPLLDENGDPTGYSIGASRHIPQPVVEVDVFQSSSGQMELQFPFPPGSEVITLSGPTTVHVFFEGANMGDANDDEGVVGLDEVQTEMVDMQLTGNSVPLGPVVVTLHPTKPSRGRIEEKANTQPGRLDLPPFALSGTADSFFDIFFKVQVGPFTFYTQQPKRLSSVITYKPPGPGDTYENLEKIPLLDENGNPTGYSIGASRHIPNPPLLVNDIVWNPDDQASRSLRFDVNPPATAAGSGVALKVTMVDLQTPVPQNQQCCPAPNFHAFDMGSPPSCPSCTGEACPADASGQGGCARWVGKWGEFRESQDVPSAGTFIGARLQCTPYYGDWKSKGLITVLGAEVLPSSTYSVQAYGASCKGSEAGCTNVSAAVEMTTYRSGDVVTPFNLVEPNGLDINEVINKFKGLTSTPKALAQLTQNVVDPYVDVGGLDISAVIDAFKSFAYSHSGPCPCPSTVTCGPAAGSVACASLQCKTCVGGTNAGKPCSLPADCPGGACSGTVLTCVKTCLGGDNIGDPCIKDIHCPPVGNTCGNPFCRDRCGRCN